MTFRVMITLNKSCDLVRAGICFNGANPSYVRFIFVHKERLELSRLSAPDPKSGVTTNSTTRAF